MNEPTLYTLTLLILEDHTKITVKAHAVPREGDLVSIAGSNELIGHVMFRVFSVNHHFIVDADVHDIEVRVKSEPNYMND